MFWDVFIFVSDKEFLKNLRFTHVRINTIPHAVPEKRSLILIFDFFSHLFFKEPRKIKPSTGIVGKILGS